MYRSKYVVLGLLGAALCGTPQISAQEVGQAPQGEQGMHQLPQSPEKIARHQAKAMQKAVDLNEKQYDKIYSLYLKEENARRKQMMNHQGGGSGMRPQGGPGMGGPGGPGGPGMGGPGGGPGMGGGQMGRAPQGGPDGQMGGARPHMNPSDAQALEKQRQKREKKIKKILSAEQYDKWLSLQPAPGEGMPPMRPGDGMPPRDEQAPTEVESSTEAPVTE
jgi:hypothetical protein